MNKGNIPAAAANACAAVYILLAAGVAAIVTMAVIFGTSKDAVYSVTVTGVAGLLDGDPAGARNLSSPVFNLTVRVDNAGNRLSAACVGSLSTVVVSCENVVLARGAVPQFCSKARRVAERGARAWGRDVALPPFLRDQLAAQLAVGQAAVDVTVTTPAEYYKDSDTVLVCSEAKIGGGPAPCREESVYHQQQAADPGST